MIGITAERRHPWIRAITLAVLMAVVVACTGEPTGTTQGSATTLGPGTTSGPGASTTTAGERDTLTLAYSADPGFLAFDTAGIATYTFTRPIYDGLFRIRPDTTSPGTVEAGAAESWEVSDDGTVWTFHLREGITFTNGEPLTSEDVKFSADLLRTGDSSAASFLSAISDVRAPDDLTVEIELATASPDFWVLIAEIIDIYPADYVQEVGEEAFNLSPVGSGPYSMVEWRVDEFVRYEVNEDYWGEPPDFEEVIIRIIPETSTAVAELQAGNIDATLIDVASLPLVEGDGDLHVISASGPTILRVILRFDQAPTDDVRVRQAMNYAIDREALAQTFYNGRTQIPASVLPVNGLGATDREPYPYDPEMARTLLEEYGQPVSFTFEFSSSQLNSDLAQALAAYWEEVGIEVELVPLEGQVLGERLRGGIEGGGAIGPVSLATWSGVSDPSPIYQFNIHPAGIFGYVNVESINEAIAASVATLDDAQREQALLQAEEECFDQACWVFLFVPDVLIGARAGVDVRSITEGPLDIYKAAKLD